MIQVQSEIEQIRAVRPEYISAADVNKIIRKMLKKAFPDTKFSVLLSSGNSTDVTWGNGPLESDVRAVIGFMHGESFDGMIDMRYSHYHFRNTDGSIVYGGTDGTQGSGGYAEAVHTYEQAGAVKVRLLNDFVFMRRNSF